ncbi:MAG: peptidylprolyl isomerase [Streptosporangiales bacterium]|nr:peptidylprolyl isomerase [Streptosporangiales bacterium]MBO0892210.1 peptidylprolyl isomerase [Acidothermales bacterium]
MPGNERRRQMQRERYQRQVARRMRKDERNRTIRAVVTSVVIVVVVVGGMSALAFTLSKKDRNSSESMPTSEAPTSSAPQSSAPTVPPGQCLYTKVPAQAGAGATKDVGMPAKKPAKQDVTATMATNRGNIVMSLDGKKAPCTVNSFQYLASKKFFDKTACHRVVNKQIYVLQCGKPAGTAQGPDYQFGTENIKGAKYTTGVLAMANSGTPDSNGSQFFIVWKNSPLPPQYTIFGHVTGGLGMVEDVGKTGPTKNDPQAGGGPPKKNVTIEKVTFGK